jgi:hypothetical protein
VLQMQEEPLQVFSLADSEDLEGLKLLVEDVFLNLIGVFTQWLASGINWRTMYRNKKLVFV